MRSQFNTCLKITVYLLQVPSVKGSESSSFLERVGNLYSVKSFANLCFTWHFVSCPLGLQVTGLVWLPYQGEQSPSQLGGEAVEGPRTTPSRAPWPCGYLGG